MEIALLIVAAVLLSISQVIRLFIKNSRLLSHLYHNTGLPYHKHLTISRQGGLSGGGGIKLGRLTNNGNGNFSGQSHVNTDDGAVTMPGAVLLAFAVFLLVYGLFA